MSKPRCSPASTWHNQELFVYEITDEGDDAMLLRTAVPGLGVLTQPARGQCFVKLSTAGLQFTLLSQVRSTSNFQKIKFLNNSNVSPVQRAKTSLS